MKKYKRQCNTHWAWHPQVIRTNQHGTNFQAEVTCLSKTDDKRRNCHFISNKGLSCDACMRRNFKILSTIYIANSLIISNYSCIYNFMI